MIKCNTVYIQSKIDSHLFTTLQQSLYAAGHHKNLTVFCLNIQNQDLSYMGDLIFKVVLKGECIVHNRNLLHRFRYSWIF